jgi:hypothetical protein
LSTEILGELYMTTTVVVLEPTDISLRVFSLVRLYTAIYLRGDLFDTAPIASTSSPQYPNQATAAVLSAFRGSRLQLAPADVKVHYHSAISLGIGAKLGQPSDRIAARIVELLVQPQQPPQDPHAVCLQVEIRSTDKGQIIWEWEATQLLAWLHHAARCLPQLPWIRVSPSPDQILPLWPACQAYARTHTWIDRANATVHERIEVEANVLDPLDYRILVELIQMIDRLLDHPMPHPVDFYVKTTKTVEQCFRSLERATTLAEVAGISAFRLGLVILIKTLLHCLLDAIFDQKLAEKI